MNQIYIKRISDTCDEIEKNLEHGKKKGYDFSYEFGLDEQVGEFYYTQLNLRSHSRNFLTLSYRNYIDSERAALSEPDNIKPLETLQKVLEAYGDHPFKHVIQGRIAYMVQSELGLQGNMDLITFKEGYEPGTVSEEFQKYAEFQFKPWNDPHLNYCSVEGLVKGGDFKLIPPDYSGKFAFLLPKGASEQAS